jgi:uncharacterized membrane protein YgdD (TMEM256/DUF423 family)
MSGMWTQRTWLTLAACGGFASVAIGAFAAHGVRDPRAIDLLKTGATYSFMHSLAVFACALVISLGGDKARHAPAFFLAGIGLFSGSLYALAAGAPNLMGIITPFGGLGFLIGWAILAWACFTMERV